MLRYYVAVTDNVTCVFSSLKQLVVCHLYGISKNLQDMFPKQQYLSCVGIH